MAESSEPTYKVRKRSTYKVGLVFKTLWSEAAGHSGIGQPDKPDEPGKTESKYGDMIYTSIRRFIIVRTYRNYCWCLSIQTYGGQGTLKRGVSFKEHAIVYTSQNPPPLLEGEQISDKYASIRILPLSPGDELNPSSRVNYHKLYTVDYNIKVGIIGQIDKDHEKRLLQSFALAISDPPSTPILDLQGEFFRETHHKSIQDDTASLAPRAWDATSPSLPPSLGPRSIFSSLGEGSSQSSITALEPNSAHDRLIHLLLHKVVLPLKLYFEQSSIRRKPFEQKFRRLIRQTHKFLSNMATTQAQLQVAKFVKLRARNAAHVVCAHIPTFQNSTYQKENTDVSDDTDASDLEDSDGEPTSFLSQDLPNIIESFLESSGSIEWLRVSIKIFLHPAGAFAQTVQQQFNHLWSTPDVLLARPVTYIVCWELPLTLRYFYQRGTPIRSFMTITGTSENAQATSCVHYLRTTWPDIAEQLLDVLDKTLECYDKGSSTIADLEITMEMSQPLEGFATVSNDISSLRCYQTPTKVSVTASYEIQVHIASALSWLTSAIRYSDDDGLCLSNPNVRVVRSQEYASLVRIENRPLKPVHQTSCWHALFANSVIANGFPIRNRQEGHGLEIPTADAFHLAGFLKLIDHEDGLLAKGLCGMLVPIKNYQFDDAIQWHLIIDPIPSLYSKKSTTRSLLEFALPQGWLKVNDPKLLTNRRAFVGWAGQAEVLIGTPSDSKLIDSSGALECRSGKPHITAYNLTAGTSGLGFFGAGGGITFAPSTICSRFVQQRQKKLAYCLQDARTSYATVYDNVNGIAWCVPESSLILCMAHNIIARRRLRIFRSGQITQLGRAERCANGGEAAWAVLKDSLQLELKFEDDDYVVETFSDMLESIFLNLNTVAERLVKVINFDKGGKRPPSWLLGYEFIDVAMETRVMTLKEKEVKQPWAQICYDTGVVLFAGAMDDAIGPHIESLLCDGWLHPPPDRGLLVVTTCAVIKFLEQHGTENGSYVSESVHWELTTPLMQQHERNGISKCFHTQPLYTVSKARRQNDLWQMLEAHKDGAFIFEKKISRKACTATLSQRTQP